jgi:hypothetical protein
MPQIGLRFKQFFQYTSANANNYNQASLSTGPYIPRTDFELSYFSIFMAGNFGSDIAFWVDDDLSVSGTNMNGGLGRAASRYRLVALAFDEHVAHLTRPTLGYFKDDSQFDGVGFSSTLHLASKPSANANPQAVEFVFPLTALL